jgi:hypothetical protein
MKKLIYVLLITASLWGLEGCNKDEPAEPDTGSVGTLPPETQIGANTFGCLINGNLLIPRDGNRGLGVSGNGMILWGSYPLGSEYNEIEVRDFKSVRSSRILVHIQSLEQLGAGDYIINESNGQNSIDGLNHNYLHCSVFDATSNTYKFYKSFENCGVIKISRFDFILSVQRIICGTFTCRVRNAANPTDEIEIKSGRFDINGATLPLKIFP